MVAPAASTIKGMRKNTSERVTQMCVCGCSQGNHQSRDGDNFTDDWNDGKTGGQYFPILPLKRIHHTDVVVLPHRFGEEQSTFEGQRKGYPTCYWDVSTTCCSLPITKDIDICTGIRAQTSPLAGSYTDSAMPLMKAPPTQVAATHAHICIRLNIAGASLQTSRALTRHRENSHGHGDAAVRQESDFELSTVCTRLFELLGLH